MAETEGSWNPPGRSMRWRVGMLVMGLIVAGIGVLILIWPQIIVWAIASIFLLVGAVLILSAVAARGAASPPPEGVFPRDASDDDVNGDV
ncbi:MAG: hypothetical protein QNJ98_13865 [Planctomycetota bacterium]|nr:hypothetical protein [Planctomycetota bacterium]